MHSWSNDSFTVTCDPARMDLAVITGFLSSSYWARGIPAATVEKSLRNSLCFALLHEDRQVGFARVITDYASHPDLQGLHRWALATSDAHGLYAKFGFAPLKRPEIFMERHYPNVYGVGGHEATVIGQ